MSDFRKFALEIFIFSALFLNASNAFTCTPGTKKITSLGAIFTCVTQPAAWGESWRDPAGVIWSGRLEEQFENRGANKLSEIIDSPAIRACQAVGGFLPTKETYFRLQSYFDKNSYNDLFSEVGIRDLFAIFPDMKDSIFWTSSVLDFNILHAWNFHGRSGWLDYGYHDTLRDRRHSVRCVSR